MLKKVKKGFNVKSCKKMLKNDKKMLKNIKKC